MSKTNKPVIFNEKDVAIYNALQSNTLERGMTFAEIKEAVLAATGLTINSGNLVGAMRKKIVVSAGADIDVIVKTKRKVSVYRFITDAVNQNESGKPFNYTDNEKAVLAAAKGVEIFTLAELATAMNVERLSSGHLNALLKKGNIAKEDEVRTLEVDTKRQVATYVLGDVVPSIAA